jgi:hypothetical protein
MKKRMIIIAGIVIIAMSGLSDIALSLTEDPQWTPYVLRWDRKLKERKKVNLAKTQSITVCSSKEDLKSDTPQR